MLSSDVSHMMRSVALALVVSSLMLSGIAALDVKTQVGIQQQSKYRETHADCNWYVCI